MIRLYVLLKTSCLRDKVSAVVNGCHTGFLNIEEAQVFTVSSVAVKETRMPAT